MPQVARESDLHGLVVRMLPVPTFLWLVRTAGHSVCNKGSQSMSLLKGCRTLFKDKTDQLG